MTDSNDNPYLGIRHVWVICTGLDESTCSNYIPEDPDVPLVADWGSATAAFGEIDAYRVYGKRISPLLIERILDPDWVEDPDDDDQLPPEIVERVVNTYTERVLVDTDMRDYIHPAIELYDGEPENGEQSVAGIIDGTYYVYPVVFKDAQICYLPRCSGTGADFTGEVCADGVIPFPLEPYFPDCDPPVYPMDAITSWIPSTQPYVDIKYSSTWEYYNLESDPDMNNLLTSSIELDMRVYPPPFDWSAGKYFHDTYTYFGNGIYH